jgi:hypothetical protein
MCTNRPRIVIVTADSQRASAGSLHWMRFRVSLRSKGKMAQKSAN